jgi:hypothetical protein
MKQRHSRDSKTDDAPRMESNFLSVYVAMLNRVYLWQGRLERFVK